jgi:hypothetical protein
VLHAGWRLMPGRAKNRPALTLFSQKILLHYTNQSTKLPP